MAKPTTDTDRSPRTRLDRMIGRIAWAWTLVFAIVLFAVWIIFAEMS
jgi:hypothetical protein